MEDTFGPFLGAIFGPILGGQNCPPKNGPKLRPVVQLSGVKSASWKASSVDQYGRHLGASC